MSSMTSKNYSIHKDEDHIEEQTEDILLKFEEVFRFINAIGLMENIFAIIIFFHLGRKNILAQAPQFMLTQQAVWDALSCAFAILTSFHATKGIELILTVNYVICSVWNSGALYFLAYNYSVYNHVLFTLERFYSIVLPLQYAVLKGFKKLILVAYYIFVFAYSFPHFIKYSYDEDSHEICIDKGDTFEKFYDFTTVAIGYLTPFTIMCVANSIVVRKIRKSAKLFSQEQISGSAGSVSAMHGKSGRSAASTALVRVTVCLGVTFILCSAFANITLFSIASGIISLSESLHRLKHLAVLTANLTMIVNPMLYIIFLPSLRKQVFAMCIS